MIPENPTVIATQFRKSVCDGIDVVPQGLNRFSVYTPFTFDDGDHYVISLKKSGSDWVLTDEGHTFMHMSYENVNFNEGTRRQIIEHSLELHGVDDMDGVLQVVVPDNRFGDALYSFVQAVSQISNVTKFTRKAITSTFYHEMDSLIYDLVPRDKVTKDWHDETRDPEGLYPVDYRISSGMKPWFVFGVHSNTKCGNATIALLHYENIQMAFQSVVFFENQTDISRHGLARLSNAAGKQFSSLHDRNRIEQYFQANIVG